MKYILSFFILFGVLLFLPVYAADQFTHDLYFGIRNNGDVIALQNFLKNQGVYAGPVTGNFYTLTREAVKNFQKREHIEPALGYVGIKTRTRINALVSLVQPIVPPVVTNPATSSVTTTPPVIQSPSIPATTTPPVVTVITPPPAPLPILQVSGSATTTFPDTDMTPLKIGEFIVANTTGQDILFANFETVIDDEMDSPANRGKKINILLRDGSTAYDSLLGQNNFTFVSAIPQIGQPYLSVINLPFGVLIKAGQQKTVSLWTEQLGYVKSGILRIYSSRINTTSQPVQGGFNFTLTRTQSL